DVARNLCEKENECVVVANKQTHGRGRHGRKWISDEGGLWVSLVWRNVNEELLRYLFIIAAQAVVDTLEQWGISARIKLPNDVYVGRSKIGGILIENLKQCVIIGIGININNTLDETMDDATSCKKILGKNLEVESVLAYLLKNLQQARKEFELNAEGFLSKVKGYLIK
ncbi:MAG TPA: biotin--[acetyl-CoA-carboxylase] ligase, partial [bacterium]|nr:biotin--[acetyl-CoA-carboxylase] ligase [bacterium]